MRLLTSNADVQEDAQWRAVDCVYVQYRARNDAGCQPYDLPAVQRRTLRRLDIFFLTSSVCGLKESWQSSVMPRSLFVGSNGTCDVPKNIFGITFPFTSRGSWEKNATTDFVRLSDTFHAWHHLYRSATGCNATFQSVTRLSRAPKVVSSASAKATVPEGVSKTAYNAPQILC